MAEPISIYCSIVSKPEGRFTKDGDFVVHFRAVQDDRYNANRGNNGPPDWQDRKPQLFFDVSAFRQEWLAEADLSPGDRVEVRGVLRQEKDYPHPQFDAIKAATGTEVWMRGGVKMDAREVLVSTAQRILSVRNPHKDGTAAARRQGGGQQAPQQAQPQGQPPAQAPQQAQQAQQPSQDDPWAQHAQQAPQQAQTDPWTQQQGQQPPQQAQTDPWAQQQG